MVWLQERPIRETVRDAHSLEFEVAAELGLSGSSRSHSCAAARRSRPGRRSVPHRTLAAGSAAALVVWLLHASIDWDWQMPAVTLPALILAGLLIALAEGEPAAPAGDPR